jgi:hypothetical protein
VYWVAELHVFSKEQLIGILKPYEAGRRGAKTADLCREPGVSEAMFFNWKSRMVVNDLVRGGKIRKKIRKRACGQSSLHPRNKSLHRRNRYERYEKTRKFIEQGREERNNGRRLINGNRLVSIACGISPRLPMTYDNACGGFESLRPDQHQGDAFPASNRSNQRLQISQNIQSIELTGRFHTRFAFAAYWPVL